MFNRVDIEVYRLSFESEEKICEYESIDLFDYKPTADYKDCIFVIHPHSRHYSFILRFDDFGSDFPFSIVPEDNRKWWMEGLPAKMPLPQRTPIKMAVLDSYHPQIYDYRYVSNVYNNRNVSSTCSHGLHVISVIDLLCDMYSFDDKEFEIAFYAIDDPDIKIGDIHRPSSGTIVSELYAALSNNADIISISAGSSMFSGRALAQLRSAVDAAEHNGAIVFAAAGNGGGNSISAPAVFDNCIGVGALCADLGAPDKTVSKLYADMARNYSPPIRDGLGSSGAPIFPWHGSAWCAGVDIAAPGAPIFIQLEERFLELAGTSFSCPIASISAARLLGETASRPRKVREIKELLAAFEAFYVPNADLS